jgi:dipeptidyl aminopeptidase/acylaminoacyl peptidase
MRKSQYAAACLFPFLLLLAMAMSTIATADPAGFGADCVASADAGERHVEGGLFDTRTPLYVMDDSGQLARVDLATATRTVLSEHAFSSMDTNNSRLSPDGRWMSYDGVAEESTTTQYWLYDLQAGTDRLVYEHPAFGGGTPVFSPDSRYLAIAANYDRRWGGVEGAGVFVYDTVTSRLSTVPLGMKTTDEGTWASTDWSRDGKELLIVLHRADSKTPEYYAYRPATQALERLSGHYDAADGGDVFERASRPVPQAGASAPRSNVRELSAWSAGEKWHAYLGKSSRGAAFGLYVADKDGVVRAVDAGHTACAADRLRIVGWLDARYLVYVNEEFRYRVHDAETGATAEMFGDITPNSFTW